jgi:hypothetical protein
MSPYCRISLCALVVFSYALQTALAAPAPGRTVEGPPRQIEAAAETPYIQHRVHRVGNMGLNITNYALLGGRKDDCRGLAARAIEFPLNSLVEYNFAGGLWVGAVVHKDTLVSMAINGNSGTQAEFFPRKYPEGDFVMRTTRPILRQPPNSFCPDVAFSPEARSEEDLIAVYSDTLGQGLGLGGVGGELRPPVGVEIRQESYAWSTEFASDFVLIDLFVRNVRDDTLHQMFFGLFMDQDVAGPSGSYDDDISGFIHSVPSLVGENYLDTVNLAFVMDNDGDPRGSFNPQSPTSAVGLRVVQAPGNLSFAYNWWISQRGNSPDWGPVKVNSTVEFPGGILGTPGGELQHYQLMSNREFDYPQWEAGLDHTADGWLPPVPNPAAASDLADGWDTRYLLSFGPFELSPDSTLNLTLACVGGRDIHVDPNNYSTYWDGADPEAWFQRLDFSNFALNAIWAGWVYDSPGFDTDGDGYKGKYRIVGGDTAYYTGDGIPDYQGPPPPPPPNELKYTTRAGKIVIRWNGRLSETRKDPFSFVEDFEGYRVYMSRTLRMEDFAMVASRDQVDWVRNRFDGLSGRWKANGRPFSLDTLKIMYDDLCDSVYGHPFHPDTFKVCTEETAMREIMLNEIDPSKLDTNLYCFERYEANAKADDTAMAVLADSLGHEVIGIIRRVYPYSTAGDSTLQLPDGTVVEWPYYEYEYAIDGLQLAEPVYLAVTAFDFGNPAARLSSLESSPLANATEIWPINAAEVVKSERPKPGVYPNPYRLADEYNARAWENPRGLEPDAERARKVTFTNVPDTCTISIWSLDGDLVRRLDHAAHPTSSDASVVVWNLITRNTQAVKTGIYIYTIESRFGTDIGKLVVVK